MFLVVKSRQSQKAKGAQCAPFALFAYCYKILKLTEVYLPLLFLFLMDIYQFFELFVGRWRSQRSDHQFGEGNCSDVRSLIEIKALSPDAPELVAICQKYNIDPKTVLHPMEMSWEEESLSSNKPKGNALIAPVPHHSDSPHKGLILSNQGKSVYEFNADEALTINTIIAKNVLEERIWYGNPNLRFRVATLLEGNQTSDRVVLSSKFYSEIRSVTPKT